MYKVYDDKTLRKLHQVEIEILDEFIRICDKYGLNYSLFAGTLLGAVRHQGFIPWDDDIDVCMLRSDYEKFLTVAKKELKGDYFLEEHGNGYLIFAKLRKNNTIFEEENTAHLNFHKGIFIDIFIMDNVSDNVKKSYLCASLFRMCNAALFVKAKIYKAKESRYPVMVSILRLLPKKFLLKIERKLCMNTKDDNSKNIACYASVYPFLKEVILRDDFLPVVKLPFEKKEYSCLRNYDKYLSSVYGNYMKLPPKEKRVNHMPERIDFGDKNED